jgi:tetratricopeptide (TPR) repeat protein
LSHISNALVVARTTALTYKGKIVDAKQIGRELNVRYILEGSVQRGASRMRINAQLIDSATGNHLWADRFDKPMADLFDMQDEIVSHLTNQLREQLIYAEAERAEREPNPNSMDYYFRGVAAFNRGRSENLMRARELFEKAVELDPTNIDALVGAVRADVVLGAAYAEDRKERLAAAEATLLKGLAIQPRNHWAHVWLGFVQILTNRAARGMGELERALSLNRNLGLAHAWTGLAKITLGRAEETEGHVAEAFRISPSDGGSFLWRNIEGVAKLHLGADAEAADLFRRSIDTSRNWPLSYFYNAAALANLGRQSEAEAEVKAGLAAAPNFSLARFRAAAESDNPVYLAQRERVIEGMRKAGVQES